MILVIAVLAILVLIATVAAATFHYRWQRAQEEAAIYESQMRFYAEALQKKNKPVEEEPEIETGSLVKRRYFQRPVTAANYRNLFDIDPTGVRILENLTTIFCKSTYVRGGQEADRESCFRAGQNSVVQHIINQINRANDPNYKEEVNA